MTVQKLNSNISDDSDDMVTLSEEEIYRRKYQMLLERCEVLQQDNERIVNRINEVKKVTKRSKRDIKLLVEQLDKHGDSFRNASIEVEPKQEVAISNTRIGSKVQTTQKLEKQTTSNAKKPPTKRKTKVEKAEKDPNAPKKPCNAFFQFCQEQRPLLVAETTTDKGLEPSKQEITRQLASRWRSLSSDEKQIYVAMFEKSREKYAEEMSAYIKKEQ